MLSFSYDKVYYLLNKKKYFSVNSPLLINLATFSPKLPLIPHFFVFAA